MKIRFVLRSFDQKLINLNVKNLHKFCLNLNCIINGIVSLPVKIKKYCVLKAPHGDKDAREMFEIRLYKYLLDVTLTDLTILDLLLKLEIQPGVSFEVKLI